LSITNGDHLETWRGNKRTIMVIQKFRAGRELKAYFIHSFLNHMLQITGSSREYPLPIQRHREEE
jgi:hypothetical protein